MTIDQMMQDMERTLTPKRYIHTINVMNVSRNLAEKYNYDTEKAAIAGLLHDCAREYKTDTLFKLCNEYNVKIDDITRAQPELLHGPLGAEMARVKYGIEDTDILKAIRYHTTGCACMGLLEKIVYIADYIEPGRMFQGLSQIREQAAKDITGAVLAALDKTIVHVISRRGLVHPDTLHARNYIILKYTME